MRVSHETIYQSLYVQGRGGLRRELAACLRTGRALRKPRRQAQARRPRIKDMVMICERPAEVADRAVPGHWEGDLITGAHNASAITCPCTPPPTSTGWPPNSTADHARPWPGATPPKPSPHYCHPQQHEPRVATTG